jgi:hypothetical protein
LSTQQLSLGLASSGVTGALSGTDWNTFNGKFNTPTGLTTNYLPKWNGSGFGNSAWQELGGRLTNGSDNGEDKLQVNGSASFVGLAKISSGVFSTPTSTGSNLYLTANGVDKKIFFGDGTGYNLSFIKKNAGIETVVARINDLGNAIEVNGNITASPAVSPNQVVVKSQLDAVAGISGSYTPTITSSTNIGSITTVKGNYIKIGNIVSVQISLEGVPTATGDVTFNCSLPFTRNGDSFVFHSGSVSVINPSTAISTNGIVRIPTGTSTTSSVFYKATSGGNANQISLNFQYNIN